jgi:hypothetical protein
MRFWNKIIFCISFVIVNGYSIAQSRIQDLTVIPYTQSILVNFIITAGNACSGYQIQRSKDSLNFHVLYDYSGICGELSKSQSISYNDAYPLKNTKSYYRILIPQDDYSTIVSTVFSDVSEKGYLLFSNPISQNLVLQSNSSQGILSIYNQQGIKINEYKPNDDGLYFEDATRLSNGLYYFLIESFVGQPVSGKFIKE